MLACNLVVQRRCVPLPAGLLYALGATCCCCVAALVLELSSIPACSSPLLNSLIFDGTWLLTGMPNELGSKAVNPGQGFVRLQTDAEGTTSSRHPGSKQASPCHHAAVRQPDAAALSPGWRQRLRLVAGSTKAATTAAGGQHSCRYHKQHTEGCRHHRRRLPGLAASQHA